MNIIFKTLNSINSFSKKIIVFASCATLIACIAGISIIAYNSCFVHEVEFFKIGSTLIQKGIIVFCHFTIGALIIDWFNANFQNDD